MFTHELLRCSKCESENITAYQIIQTRKQIVIWYRCIDCGIKDKLALDISEKVYLLGNLSRIFFKCYRCGSPIVIQELKSNAKVKVLKYLCLKKGKSGKKIISNVLYSDLRMKYLSIKEKPEQPLSDDDYKKIKSIKITCPNCKNLISRYAKYCTYCGINLDEFKHKNGHCSRCGAVIKPNANFCTSCGLNLKAEKSNLTESNGSDDPFKNQVECHYCGAIIPDGENCPVCGARLHCECGALYKQGAKYCMQCGREVEIPDENEEEFESENYVVCPNCKNEVQISYNYCTFCGYNMENVVPEKKDKQKNLSKSDSINWEESK
ncbi:MAG: double zinc ribbon domain-containing protein [Candidatus Helarchaeota archaeon]